jgi:PAS domain S-box-containing protein
MVISRLFSGGHARRRLGKRIRLESRVAKILLDAWDLEAAAPEILQLLCRETGGTVAELWLPIRSAEMERRAFVSLLESDERAELERVLGAPAVAADDGLVGRARVAGRAQSTSGLAETLRSKQGAASGLTSGLAFPLLGDRRCLGVISIYSDHRLAHGSIQLQLLEDVGREIGEFVLRVQADRETARLAAIVDSSQDAILSKDLRGIVLSWNGAAERLYGYSAAEIIGQSIDLLMPPHRGHELDRILERIGRGEKVEHYDTTRLRKDGTEVDVSVSISPIKDRRGRVVAASAIARDITEKKRAEAKLREADRQKDEFLAMLGHELRNPLAAISSAAELIKLQSTTPQFQETQAILERQAAHMTRLLNGMLDISRISRGKIVLQLEPLDLFGVLRDVLRDQTGQMEAREAELRIELPDAPAWVEGDRVRLAQVFSNLLSNARKFTDPGDVIAVTASRDDSRVSVLISDTGAGIAGDLLPHIFQAFRQAEQTLDRAGGGLGLGLALVKSIVELHKGTIEARSKGPDKGSEFELTLPLSDSRPPRREQKHCKARASRVLVVEDNEDAAALLCKLLTAAGHEPRVAHDGKEGLAVAKTMKPDIVLCDLGLPGEMQGCDVARAIRRNPELRDTRLVAVSGYGRTEDIALAKRHGFDAHLVKPASSACFLETETNGNDLEEHSRRTHGRNARVEVGIGRFVFREILRLVQALTRR